MEGKTGLFFHEQSVEALVGALTRFEKEVGQFVPAEIRAHALKFDTRRFERELRRYLAALPGLAPLSGPAMTAETVRLTA